MGRAGQAARKAGNKRERGRQAREWQVRTRGRMFRPRQPEDPADRRRKNGRRRANDEQVGRKIEMFVQCDRLRRFSGTSVLRVGVAARFESYKHKVEAPLHQAQGCTAPFAPAGGTAATGTAAAPNPPVEPKPPAPRSVALSDATSCGSGVTMRSRMSWAMRSPMLTAWPQRQRAGAGNSARGTNAERDSRTHSGSPPWRG